MKLKLQKHRTTEETAFKRFNTAFLTYTDKLNEFEITQQQDLQDLLKEEETAMEDSWNGNKEALTPTCQEVLGLKKHHWKQWISTETLKMTQKNGRTRRQHLMIVEHEQSMSSHKSEYIEANKLPKKSIKAINKKYIENISTTTERSAKKGNTKQPYDTTKKLEERYSKPKQLVKNKEGKPITKIQ
ncbi:unnamed protein product [Schistosoma margrebowiei]|uniref:Uncharacterized protein n=1 Tax=Schistosoma margrebowiei TaxID=48269 RepID=A0A183LEU3_9TREM|nr:unnamed protein product [Schistosoma margrebowiei]